MSIMFDLENGQLIEDQRFNFRHIFDEPTKPKFAP